MQDFFTYFLSHLPTPDEWVAYLLVNLVAYGAARNSVLRRERKAYAEQVRQLEAERRLHMDSIDELERLNKEYWAMIKKQSDHIDDLTSQLSSVKRLHLN
jgi:uncharacterized coiled-coil protein SlyX